MEILPNTAPPRSQLLIGTDDPDACVESRAALQAAGFEIRTAATPGAMLRALEEPRPDVLVVGFESLRRQCAPLCRELRKVCAEESIPILVASPESGREALQAASEAGASDLVSLPLCAWKLVHRVRQLADHRALAIRSRRAELSLETVQRTARLGVWEWGPGSDDMSWSDGFFQMLGFRPGGCEVGFESFILCVHPKDRDGTVAQIRRAVASRKPFSIAHRVVLPGGAVRHVQTCGSVLPDADGMNVAVLGSTQDVTEARRYEARIHALAHFDGLTGLSNREYFGEQLANACSQARRSGDRMALLYLDLDHFKRINDTLGHRAGDRMLQASAESLVEHLRASDVVGRCSGAETEISRIGGDEFAVLLTRIRDPIDAERVAERLVGVMSRPTKILGHEVVGGVSIGIAIFPNDGLDAETLARHADRALYQVKNGGRGGFAFFADSMNAWPRRRLEVESNLRAAIENDELYLLYQPRLDLHSQRIRSAEALLRWRSPVLGMVQPSEFIRVAEETGMIVPIGEWVLRQACAQIRRWSDSGFDDLIVSVNVSTHQLIHDDLMRTVADALESNGVDPRNLELEITESALLEDDEKTAILLRDLRAIGLRIALDDFGTGYSSLSYLGRFPLDVLKLDRAFLRELGSNTSAVAIATAVISVAHSLGLRVVAEGVDEAEKASVLLERGCDEIQGFLVAPALDAGACQALFGTPFSLDAKNA